MFVHFIWKLFKGRKEMEEVIRGILTTYIYRLLFWSREVFCVADRRWEFSGSTFESVYQLSPSSWSSPPSSYLAQSLRDNCAESLFSCCWAGVEIRFRSMTHDSPGSHLIQYVPNWHYTFREFVRTKNNQRHEWGRWLARNTNTSAPHPSIPRSSRVVSWTLNRYWWRWRVKETDTDRKKEDDWRWMVWSGLKDTTSHFVGACPLPSFGESV